VLEEVIKSQQEKLMDPLLNFSRHLKELTPMLLKLLHKNKKGKNLSKFILEI
jgi:hypothetical protein